MDGHGFGMGWGMWFIPATVLIIFIILIWRLSGTHVTHHHHHSSSGSAKETPLDILKKRYSRGEITKDEFEQMKKDIS